MDEGLQQPGEVEPPVEYSEVVSLKDVVGPQVDAVKGGVTGVLKQGIQEKDIVLTVQMDFFPGGKGIAGEDAISSVLRVVGYRSAAFDLPVIDIESEVFQKIGRYDGPQAQAFRRFGFEFGVARDRDGNFRVYVIRVPGIGNGGQTGRLAGE